MPPEPRPEGKGLHLVPEPNEAERPVEQPHPQHPETRRGGRVWAWAVLIAAFAVFAFFGTVPTHAYIRNSSNRVVPSIRDEGVREIWQLQADNLPDVGGNLLPTAVFYTAILLFVLGSAGAVWFALAPNPAWADQPAADAGVGSREGGANAPVT